MAEWNVYSLKMGKGFAYNGEGNGHGNRQSECNVHGDHNGSGNGHGRNIDYAARWTQHGSDVDREKG